MKDLFQLLASNEGKTPDQIVRALCGPVWVHLATITPEVYAQMFEKECVIVNRRRDGSWHVVHTKWTFWFTLEYCGSWPDGWICLMEEWKRGDLPDPPA